MHSAPVSVAPEVVRSIRFLQTGMATGPASVAPVHIQHHVGDVVGIRVVETRSDDDRQAVFALRYEVYVAEMRRHQSHFDHARRMLAGHLTQASCRH